MKIQDLGKIGVIYGGDSSEREISLKSGAFIIQQLEQMGIDVVGVDLSGVKLINFLLDNNVKFCFLALHGKGGEDGSIQGLLKSINIPFTGSDISSSAISMNKVFTKILWQSMNLQTPSFCVMDTDKTQHNLSYPIAIKPVSEGSSIGVNKISSAEDIPKAYENANRYGLVMAEEWIEGVELFVPIIGDEVLPPVRVKPASEFYDFNSKYINQSEYFCPSGLSDLNEQRVKELAYKAFQSLGCSGWGRVDCIMSEDGKLYLLEVNTVPGMTDKSLVPISAKAYGWSSHQLITNILQSSSYD